jgi:hypothetical protein
VRVEGRTAVFSRWTGQQLVFISLMVAADVSMGLVVKPLLGMTGVDQVIRLDLVIPTAFYVLTRLLVDRFGTVFLYQLLWGVIAVFTMPMAYASIPGPAKLIPAITSGLVLDSLLGLFRNRPAIRVTLAAVLGGCINTAVLMAVRVAFGFPWSRLVRVLLGVQMGTNVVVYGAGAILGLKIWRVVKDAPLARTLSG